MCGPKTPKPTPTRPDRRRPGKPPNQRGPSRTAAGPENPQTKSASVAVAAVAAAVAVVVATRESRLCRQKDDHNHPKSLLQQGNYEIETERSAKVAKRNFVCTKLHALSTWRLKLFAWQTWRNMDKPNKIHQSHVYSFVLFIRVIKVCKSYVQEKTEKLCIHLNTAGISLMKGASFTVENRRTLPGGTRGPSPPIVGKSDLQ